MSEMIELMEASEALSCTPETVVDLLKSGELPGWKPGRSWVIPRAAFFGRVNEIALQEASKRRGCADLYMAQLRPSILDTPRRKTGPKPRSESAAAA